MRSRGAGPTVRRTLIDLFVGPGRLELPQIRLKVGCIAFLPRALDADGGRAFELLLHHVGALGIEPRRCRARVGYSHARSHAGLRARKREEPPRVLPRAAPDRFGFF